MIKLFEYKIHTETREAISFCWKVFSKLFALFMILTIIAVCASCQQENIESEETEGQPAVVRLTVTGEEQVNVTTRTVNEDAIHDLHILIYDNKGELIGQQYTTKNIVTLNTHSAENCTIYAIANTGEPNLFNNYNIHSETILKELSYSISTWDELTNQTYLPMTGRMDKINITAGEQTISGMKVSRMVAKITLNIKAAINSNITIKDYSIYSLPLKSYYIPRPLSTESSEIDTNATHADDAANATNAAHWTDCPKTTLNAATSTTIIIYMLENRRGVVSSITNQKDKNSTKAPAHATYIEINGLVGGTVKANWKIYLGGNNSNNFNIKRNCSYVYNITLNELITTDTRVELDFTDVQNLSRTGTANCYLAAKCNYWYKFNATIRGNGAATPADISPTGTALATNALINPTSTELVWETGGKNQIIKSLFLQDGYVYFKTGNTIQGNAVISVKANNKILWSWHIWKSTFDLSTFNTLIQEYKTNPIKDMNYMYYNGLSARNLIMMDRNLGAATNSPSQTNEVAQAFGLYYQFGRKDPFPPAKYKERQLANNSEIVDIFDKNGKKLNIATLRSSNYQNTALSGLTLAQNITNTINNPLTFITQNDADNSENWIYGAIVGSNYWKSSNKLWGGDLNDENNSLRLDTKFTGKTIYDPCPIGWCVPPQDTWTNFVTLTSSDNNGNYNVNGLLPVINGIYQNEHIKYFNCVNEDKAVFADGDGAGFSTAPIFGRRFYINGKSGTTAFWPAGGFRSGKDGTITEVGLSSSAWSSSPIQATFSQGSGFQTTISAVVPVKSIGRSNAFPIRCIQERCLK